jgi:hypothetical protein
LASQVFAGEELERLRGFPEIGRDELFRFFTLTSADVAFVDPGRGRGPADRLTRACLTSRSVSVKSSETRVFSSFGVEPRAG